ncbi:MAG: hypothetical protein WD845_12920 [Pirellulales bacterium]
MSQAQESTVSQEQRAAFRCASDDRFGQLRCGDRTVEVAIVDESANGFGVVALDPPACDVGETVQLRTEAGWTETRVMNMQPVAVATSHDADTSTVVMMTRLGLMRLTEARAEEDEGAGLLDRIDFKSLRVALTSLGLSAGGALAMAVGIVLGGLFMIWAFDRPALPDQDYPLFAPRFPSTKPPIELPEIIVPQIELGETEHMRQQMPSLRPASKSPRESFSTGDSLRDLLPDVSWRDLLPLDASSDSPSGAVVPPSVVRASRPEALLEDEAVRLLALEPEQLAQLRRLAEEQQAWERQRQQDASTGGATSDRATDLEIGLRALAVLNDRQRNSWMAMLRNRDAATTKTGSQEPSRDAPQSEYRPSAQ